MAASPTVASVKVHWLDPSVELRANRPPPTALIGAVLRGPAQRPVRFRTVQVEGEDLLTEA